MGEGAHDSDAHTQLCSFFERWQRLETEKVAIGSDLRELFAEMKANGFDAKVARKVFRDKVADANALAEFQSLYDLYASSLGMDLDNARDAREAA